MRVAIFIVFAILCRGQAEEVIERAQALANSGNLREAEQELIGLLSRPEAAAYDVVVTATAYADLATVYHDMGRVMQAEHAYEKARSLLGEHSTDAMRRILWFRITSNLASMYMESGQTGKAERLVEVLLKRDVPEGEDAGRFKGTQASLLMVRGRHKDAEKLFLSLLEHWRQHGNAKEMAVVLNNLGVLAIRRGDPRTAAVKLGQSLEMWNKAVGANHPAVLSASANYGYALLLAGRKEQAAALIEKSLAVARTVHGEGTPITAHLATLWAEALRATGRGKEASRAKAEAERMSSALSASDPSRHTVDVLDLVRQR